MGRLILKIGLLFCFFTMVLGLIIGNNNNENIKHVDSQYNIDGYKIKLPESAVEKNPELAFNILLTSANKNKTSFINRVTEYTVKRDQGEIDLASDIIKVTYFIDDNAKTSFLSKFNPKVIKGKTEHLFNSNVFTEINKIKNVTRSDIVNGDYFIQGTDSQIQEMVLDSISTFKNQMGLTLVAEELIDDSMTLPIELIPTLDIQALLMLGVLFFLCCLVIYSLLVTRDIQILRMNGYSVLEIAWHYLLRDINAWMLATLLCLLLAKVIFSTFLLNSQLLSMLILLTAILNLIIFILLKSISFLSAKNALNYKNYDKDFFYVVYAIKIFFLFTVITSLSPLTELLKDSWRYASSLSQQNLPENSKVGIFYPLLIGKDNKDITYNTNVFFENLSQSADRIVGNKGFIIDISSYEQTDSFFDKVIKVDTSYLKNHIKVDYQDKKIKTETKDGETLFLISEKLKDRRQEIRDYYKANYDMTITFIVISDKTKLPLYNNKKRELTGALLIEVLKSPEDIPIIKGLGGIDPLKIVLGNRSPESIYKQLKNSIDTEYLDDNLVSIVKLSDVNRVILLRQLGTFYIYLFQTLFSLSLTIFIIIQCAIAYYNQKKKIITILRIHGYSFFQTYKNFFLLLLIQNTLFILLFMATYPERLIGSFVTCLLLSMIEFVTSVIVIIKFDRVKKVEDS
ncbi:hypothetical protein BCR22_02130 [Enterococcus plantarum]|nr:hypothetical protein BCR22_02130 [Enterococcus plantarum]